MASSRVPAELRMRRVRVDLSQPLAVLPVAVLVADGSQEARDF